MWFYFKMLIRNFTFTPYIKTFNVALKSKKAFKDGLGGGWTGENLLLIRSPTPDLLPVCRNNEKLLSVLQLYIITCKLKVIPPNCGMAICS